MMTMKGIWASCSDLGNTCPSRKNCQRFTDRHMGMDTAPAAALNCRREAGASACDMWVPIKVVSTFLADDTEGGAA